MNVLERLILLQILNPYTGTFDEVTQCNKISDKTVFTEEEQKELEMVTEGNQVKWNKDKECKPVELTKEDKKLIKLALDQYKANLEKKKAFDKAEVSKVTIVEGIIGENGVKKEEK
jgi:hypothetical protein